MYDPVQLRTFLTVAQTLSFTQAAGRLGVRQSTVGPWRCWNARVGPGGSRVRAAV
ncbi:LysR family transcriptional regulator [Streptomyces sp. 147326]|uniref:helix-turn-helix domain-containing protein n=1 Tax=Streptomyces sp. 147326 TaxID=3074379 RepID=UPI0038577EE2